MVAQTREGNCLAARDGAAGEAPPATPPETPEDTGPTGLTITGEVPDYAPVTDEMLRNPDVADWLMLRGHYQAWNYSSLTQVTRENVGDLRLVWVWAMNEGQSNQPAPIVHDGTIYLNNTGNTVQALAGRTGELIWEKRLGGRRGGAMRGLAIYDDKVIVATTDARLVALDARSGETVWETVIGDRTNGSFGNSSGPIVIDGTVVQGLTGCGRYRAEKCFISVYDASDGSPVWKFNTIARAGEPGGDTWGNLPDLFRAGGETWITGTYDPELDLTYWGVAQAKPWMAASRGATVHDKELYTNATVALSAADGKLAWYFQHAPGWIWTRSSSASLSMSTAGSLLLSSESPASSGNWIGRPASISTTRKPSSRTSTIGSIRRQASPNTGSTLWSRRRISGYKRVPARKAATTGRR